MSGERVDWEECEVFQNDKFIVQVSKLPLRYPLYSLSISAKSPTDGRSLRFIPVKAEGQGIVQVRPVLADLRELLDSAEAYIERKLQYVEDQRIEDMQAREARQTPKGLAQPKGLKAWSKHDKKRNHSTK
jgi:hypothetical protein